MGKRIKILHICDKFGVKGSSVHGVSRLFQWWFPRFESEKYDVELVGLRSEDRACENLKESGINVISLGKGKFDFSTTNEIIKLVRKKKVDILHLHGYGAANFGRIAGKICKTKTIVHEHFVDLAMPKYQIPMDYFLSGMSDVCIAVSKAVKEFMVKKRFIDRDKIRVIFNGAPLEEFKSLGGDLISEEKKRWRISNGIKIVATIGRLDEIKGIKYFIDAAAKILKKGYKVKFMVIGDGPILNELKRQCRTLQVEKDILFTGYHNNIPLIMSAIDIQVFSSIMEGAPLSLFEAMSMKKTIVATNIGGLGEILTHEKNALLVAPKNPEMLADGIEKVLINTELAINLAKHAEEDSHIYDIKETVKQIQQVYDHLLL